MFINVCIHYHYDDYENSLKDYYEWKLKKIIINNEKTYIRSRCILFSKNVKERNKEIQRKEIKRNTFNMFEKKRIGLENERQSNRWKVK